MKSFLKSVFAGMIGTFLAIGGLTAAFGMILIVLISLAFTSPEQEISHNEAILHLKLNTPITEQSSSEPDLVNLSVKTTLGLRHIINAIEKAETDSSIKGIYLDLSAFYSGFATAKEIRDALIKFKSSEKFIVAHADSYSLSTYYLASAADKVFLTPEGDLEFTGLSANIVFFKSMLAKIGVEPIAIRHGKFKSAVEPFIQDRISDANLKQTKQYVESLWNTCITDIGSEREIAVPQLDQLADKLMIRNAVAAKQHNLVDDTKYEDQVFDELKKLSGLATKDTLELIPLAVYATPEPNLLLNDLTGNAIAVIYAEGTIVSGYSENGTIGSETTCEAIRKARKNDKVKAIVLRVNSPGGSALASEVIWREVVLAKKAKPLIVSFGDVAASGGYYIGCAGDQIVAEPNTITGSIGVFGLMFNAQELLSSFGINTHTITSNTYSDITNPTRKMSEQERAILQQSVEEVYTTFISRVAEGRKMSNEAVDAIAQGRVWTGTDAKRLGLVDQLGGLNDSISIAAEKAGIANYTIVSFPEMNRYERVINSFFGNAKKVMIEDELGDASVIYHKLKEVRKIKGIQTRLPFFIDFK